MPSLPRTASRAAASSVTTTTSRQTLYDDLVAAGAAPVSSREIVQRLTVAGLRRRKATSMARRAVGNVLLRPPRLEPGDVVAVVATSGVVPEDRLRVGVERLTSWGLEVRVAPHVLGMPTRLSYLAGSDEDRAADFTEAWLDPTVSAVWAARGGYGAQRMLDLLDWRRLAEAEPRLLVGFSDVTALHQAMASRLGLVDDPRARRDVARSRDRGQRRGAAAAVMEPESVVDCWPARS